MKKEILFKAKRISDRKWVFGGTIVQFLDNGIRSFYMPQFNEKCDCVHDDVTDDILEFTNCNFYKVDGNTICQYTGLDDKNGNMIWENDIVKHKFTFFTENIGSGKKGTKNYVIKWDNTGVYLGYRYHNKRNIFPFKKGTCWNGDDEVIGNIFDNKELLQEAGGTDEG